MVSSARNLAVNAEWRAMKGITAALEPKETVVWFLFQQLDLIVGTALKWSNQCFEFVFKEFYCNMILQ